MESVAVDNSVNIPYIHSFGVTYVAVPEKCYRFVIDFYDSVYYKNLARIRQNYMSRFYIFRSYGSEVYGLTAEEEWKHTLSANGDGNILTIQKQIPDNGKHPAVISWFCFLTRSALQNPVAQNEMVAQGTQRNQYDKTYDENNHILSEDGGIGQQGSFFIRKAVQTIHRGGLYHVREYVAYIILKITIICK